MLLFIKVVDIIKEPFIGWFIDSLGTYLKLNKFRVFIFVGTLLNAAVTVAMFNVPHLTTENFEIL